MTHIIKEDLKLKHAKSFFSGAINTARAVSQLRRTENHIRKVPILILHDSPGFKPGLLLRCAKNPVVLTGFLANLNPNNRGNNGNYWSVAIATVLL